MNVHYRYFKRFRMELEFRREPPPTAPPLPPGYYWLPWDRGLIVSHARTKFECFAGELDTQVFPSLGSMEGCERLMRAIADRPGFLPGATWLIGYGTEYVGTVQGVRMLSGWGAIQNLGVTPGHRGLGLGRQLLLRALEGFRNARLPGAVLEVTAENAPAIALYRQLGFRCRKTVYKTVESPQVYSLVADPVLAR